MNPSWTGPLLRGMRLTKHVWIPAPAHNFQGLIRRKNKFPLGETLVTLLLTTIQRYFLQVGVARLALVCRVESC